MNNKLFPKPRPLLKYYGNRPSAILIGPVQIITIAFCRNLVVTAAWLPNYVSQVVIRAKIEDICALFDWILVHHTLLPRNWWYPLTICDPLSENPHSSHNIKKKTKLKNYLWNYWKIFTRVDGASNQQRKLRMNKNYIPSYSPGYGELEILCFVSVAWTVRVSHVFVYNAVDVNKIATTFFGKIATIDKSV